MVVGIDCGHGIDTPGKRSPAATFNLINDPLYFREYKSNRILGEMVADLLVFQGIDARIIVPEEYDVSLQERVNRINKLCKQYGTENVICLSVHSNAAKSGRVWTDARGWAVYTTPGQTKSDLLATEMFEVAKKEFYDPNREYAQTFDFRGRQKPIRSDWSDGDADYEAAFFMLRKTWCTAVLVENFFQDNKLDVAYLNSDKGRGSCAYVMSEGIINYIEKYGLAA